VKILEHWTHLQLVRGLHLERNEPTRTSHGGSFSLHCFLPTSGLVFFEWKGRHHHGPFKFLSLLFFSVLLSLSVYIRFLLNAKCVSWGEVILRMCVPTYESLINVQSWHKRQLQTEVLCRSHIYMKDPTVWAWLTDPMTVERRNAIGQEPELSWVILGPSITIYFDFVSLLTVLENSFNVSLNLAGL
jgi:hypothetical protein